MITPEDKWRLLAALTAYSAVSVAVIWAWCRVNIWVGSRVKSLDAAWKAFAAYLVLTGIFVVASVVFWKYWTGLAYA